MTTHTQDTKTDNQQQQMTCTPAFRNNTKLKLITTFFTTHCMRKHTPESRVRMLSSSDVLVEGSSLPGCGAWYVWWTAAVGKVHRQPALELSLTFQDERCGTESVVLHHEHQSATLPASNIIITSIIIVVVYIAQLAN